MRVNGHIKRLAKIRWLLWEAALFGGWTRLTGARHAEMAGGTPGVLSPHATIAYSRQRWIRFAPWARLYLSGYQDDGSIGWGLPARRVSQGFRFSNDSTVRIFHRTSLRLAVLEAAFVVAGKPGADLNAPVMNESVAGMRRRGLTVPPDIDE